jgi:hypothetical protein
VNRRGFDHLVAEISVAVGVRIPRYALWSHLHEHGADPDALTARASAAYCGQPLETFLAARGLHIDARAQRRLRRCVARFDPNVPTPEELLFGAR